MRTSLICPKFVAKDLAQFIRRRAIADSEKWRPIAYKLSQGEVKATDLYLKDAIAESGAYISNVLTDSKIKTIRDSSEDLIKLKFNISKNKIMLSDVVYDNAPFVFEEDKLLFTILPNIPNVSSVELEVLFCKRSGSSSAKTNMNFIEENFSISGYTVLPSNHSSVTTFTWSTSDINSLETTLNLDYELSTDIDGDEFIESIIKECRNIFDDLLKEFK